MHARYPIHHVFQEDTDMVCWAVIIGVIQLILQILSGLQRSHEWDVDWLQTPKIDDEQYTEHKETWRSRASFVIGDTGKSVGATG